MPPSQQARSTSKGLGRNDIIDAYRAVLIFAVLLFHYLVRWAPNYDDGFNLTHWEYTYSHWFALGKYGVHVFFVISGLVIAMTVENCKDTIEFAYRRFSRLYPAYVFCATFTFVIMYFWGPSELRVGLRDYLLTLTMAPANLGGAYVDGAYWSLTVEVKFYAWVAIGFLLLKQRFWMFALALGIAGTLLEKLGFHGVAVAVLISPYMSFFLIGMSAWYLIFRDSRAAGLATGAAGLTLYLLNAAEIDLHGQPSLIANIVVAATIGSLLFLLTVKRSFALGPLPFIGRISYTIYLIHQNLGVMLIGFLKQSLHVPDWLAFVAAASMSIGFAAFSYKFIEGPAQSWLRTHYMRMRNLKPHTTLA